MGGRFLSFGGFGGDSQQVGSILSNVKTEYEKQNGIDRNWILI